jgi:transcriptional regulator with XRE-family HTH domain
MPRPIRAPRFGARLRAARENRGWSLGQVVARVHRRGPAYEGFGRAQLTRYERGETPTPDPVTVVQLARLYGLEPLDLFDLLIADREDDPEASARASPPGTRSARGRRRAAR